MENKQAIVKSLEATLKLTRAGTDIEELNYIIDEHHNEYVSVKYRFTSKLQLINVSMDSGISLMNDVVPKIHDMLV